MQQKSRHLDILISKENGKWRNYPLDISTNVDLVNSLKQKYMKCIITTNIVIYVLKTPINSLICWFYFDFLWYQSSTLFFPYISSLFFCNSDFFLLTTQTFFLPVKPGLLHVGLAVKCVSDWYRSKCFIFLICQNFNDWVWYMIRHGYMVIFKVSFVTWVTCAIFKIITLVVIQMLYLWTRKEVCFSN